MHGNPYPPTCGACGRFLKRVGVGEITQWLQLKLTAAEKELKARLQMEECWRGGTDESWRAVGCKMKKAQRLKESEIHGRISKKSRRDVEMFKAVIAICENEVA